MNNKYWNFWYECFVKLVLEVFGASGAVWGTSEVLTFRNSDTQDEWRGIASAIGLIFLFRFWIEQSRKFKILKLELEQNSIHNSENQLENQLEN